MSILIAILNRIRNYFSLHECVHVRDILMRVLHVPNVIVRRADCLVLSVSSYSSRFAIARGENYHSGWFSARFLSRGSHTRKSRALISKSREENSKGRGRRCYLLRFIAHLLRKHANVSRKMRRVVCYVVTNW